MVLVILNGKAYSNRLSAAARNPEGDGKKKTGTASVGDRAMTAMFIGLVSAYIAGYIGRIVSENGLFTFSGNWLPLAVAVIAALAMLVFLKIREAKNAEWLDSFSVAGSMLVAMTCAIFLGKLM